MLNQRCPPRTDPPPRGAGRAAARAILPAGPLPQDTSYHKWNRRTAPGRVAVHLEWPCREVGEARVDYSSSE